MLNDIRINRFCALPTKPAKLRQSFHFKPVGPFSLPPPVTHIFPLRHVPFNQQIVVPSSLSNVLSITHRSIEKYTIKKKKKQKNGKKRNARKNAKENTSLRNKKYRNHKKKNTKNRNTPIKRKYIPKNDHQNEKKRQFF